MKKHLRTEQVLVMYSKPELAKIRKATKKKPRSIAPYIREKSLIGLSPLEESGYGQSKSI